MLEVMNESSEISEQTIELLDKHDQHSFKLPRIERLPSSGVPKQIRSTTRLPTLRNDPSLEHLEVSSERRLPEEQNFIGTVERRVRLVMQEQNIAEEEESEDSSDDHFVRKIKENKELIKQAKRKNQQARKENEQLNNYVRPMNFPKKGSAKLEQERKMREYREGTGENRVLQRRKESQSRKEREFSRPRGLGKESAPHKDSTVLKENHQNKEVLVREFKSRDELTPLNKILPSPLAHIDEKKMKKQMSVKNLTPVQKNEQLFDAIHNYLENPKRSEPEINTVKICQNKAELEQRLREYQQRLQQTKDLQLPHKQSVQTQRSEPLQGSEIQMATSSQWRKIGRTIKGLFAQESSSFDQEIECINRYLARNEKSLDRYVENQKMLIDVQLARKQSAKGR